MKRAIAEFLGAGLLVAVVVGSGTMAVNISQDIGVQLLINTVATIFVLGLLIELLGPISGAHFNPLVTIMNNPCAEDLIAEGVSLSTKRVNGRMLYSPRGNVTKLMLLILLYPSEK